MEKPQFINKDILSLPEAVKYIQFKYDDVDYGAYIEMRDYLDNFTDMSVDYTEIDIVQHFADALKYRAMVLINPDDSDDTFRCEDGGYRLMFLLIKEFGLEDTGDAIIWKL